MNDIEKKKLQEYGEELTKGGVGYLLKIAIVIWVITIALTVFSGKDSTDPENGRSGLKIYTDNLTGVQYVGTRNGLTVRVSRSGKPIYTE